MGHRTKSFCYCDGCGLEQIVTHPVVPNDWIEVTTQPRANTQHYCPTCWTVGITAILDAVTNRLKAIRGGA